MAIEGSNNDAVNHSPKIKKAADNEVFDKIKVVHTNIKAEGKNVANFS